LTKAGQARSETVVDTETQQIRGEAVVGSGQDEAAIGQVEIEPFGFRRPALAEADFDAGTGYPAEADMRLRQTGAVRAEASIREASGSKEQDVADGHAATAAQGSEQGLEN